MKKKLIAILLCAAMALSLAACAKTEKVASGPDASESSSLKDRPKLDKDRPGKIEKPSKPVDGADPGPDPDGQAGGPGSAGAPSGIEADGSGNEEEDVSEGGSAGVVDLGAFAAVLRSGYEMSGFLQRQDPDSEDGKLMIDNYFPGLLDLDLVQCEVYLCMISFNSGEFSLVEAASEQDAKAAGEVFQARIDSMLEEGANYPDTIQQWQDGARVVVRGNYAMLICADECDDIVAAFEAQVG